jgi:hypothetical protein
MPPTAEEQAQIEWVKDHLSYATLIFKQAVHHQTLLQIDILYYDHNEVRLASHILVNNERAGQAMRVLIGEVGELVIRESTELETGRRSAAGDGSDA